MMRSIPQLHLINLPTPIERLNGLTSKLDGPEVFIKRDDLTGIAFGGNKTRKLEFLVAEAVANGAKTLVTSGSIQSNHCRQTAAVAAKLGLDCVLVLSKLSSTDELRLQEDQVSGNLLLDRLLNAQLIIVDKNNRSEALGQAYQDAWKKGKRPYLIPYGGSNSTGASAYAFAMSEVLEQGHSPDSIVIASSSGGTQAGLVAGAAIMGYQGKIIGISIDESASVMKKKIAGLATETADLLGSPRIFTPSEIIVFDEYLGEGYGVCGEAEKSAILLFSQMDAIFLDPVYTGRAAAGMLDMIRKGWFKGDNTILFWHTGGTPALFTGYYARYLLG